MSAAGVTLNGNVTVEKNLALSAWEFDRVPDEDGNPPTIKALGFFGDAESPRFPGGAPDPNGFNIAESVILFVRDSDPSDGIDDSFLYFGWDIADGHPSDSDGVPPVQYDSDDDGSASELGPCTIAPCAISDRALESYAVLIQGCVDEAVFDPDFFTCASDGTTMCDTDADCPNGDCGSDLLADPNAQNIAADFDLLVLMQNVQDCAQPVSTMSTPISGLAARVLAFPTADGITNLSNECIDLEIQECAAGNDVEMVIKGIETSGAFGEARRCSGNNALCTVDTDCPAPQTCSVVDPVQARLARFRLAELLVQLQAATTGDFSDEEFANVTSRLGLPSLEVSKRVRCADDGEQEFTEGPIEALVGSRVEYQITVRNTGNEDLAVTLTDVLNAIGGQAEFGNCAPDCDSITAALTSPRRSLNNFPVTFMNAASPPICSGLGQPECLNTDFFIPSCNPNPQTSFMETVQNGGSVLLGTLLGVSTDRDDNVCTVTEGDTIVIMFEAIVGPDELNTPDFCAKFDEPDCRNSISATATLVGGGAIVAQDQAGTSDTEEEDLGGGDDNIAEVDVLCREILFRKEVGFPGNEGSFTTGTSSLDVPSVPPAGNVQIQYRYTVDNFGEVPELVTINDSGLCADVAATNAMFAGAITLVACPICPSGSVGPTLVNPLMSLTSNCTLQFNAVAGPDSNAGLRFFLALDDSDGACGGEPGLTGSDDMDCYRNCASATTTTNNFGDICRPPIVQFNIPSFTTICNRTCMVDVVKEVRCLPNCNTTSIGAEVGWVDNLLDVTPGSCIQYRIRVQNISPNLDICALKFDDIMSPNDEFASIPTNVQMVGKSCTNVNFATAFNVIGTDVTCNLNSALTPGSSLSVLFQATLEVPDGTPDADQLNTITVMGAAEVGNVCPATPTFSCMDTDTATVDIEECNFTVDKDVTCDDPRVGTPTYEPEGDDLAEALPGAEVGFRIQVTNSGTTNITSVDLTDDLTCSTWFVAGSVVADVNGTAVTNCICTSPVGNCDAVTDLNGVKNLTTCKAAGIAPGQTLTITFRVRSPANFGQAMAEMNTPIDCTNTVTVEGITDLCRHPTNNPCPEASSMARINVRVPKLVCDKQVCADLDNNGTCDAAFPFAENLDLPAESAIYPLTIHWKYIVNNTGETAYSAATITDLQLVTDRNANGLVGPSCALNGGGVANLGAIAQGGMAMATCSITFPTEQDWLEFAAKDDDGIAGCYRNSATGSGTVNTAGLCARLANTTVNTTPCLADVCIRQPCEIRVVKQQRCLTTCSPTGLGAEEGWTNKCSIGGAACDSDADCAPSGGTCNTAPLMVTPGSCVQYRIVVINISDAGVPVCALKFDDLMSNQDSFQTIPTGVQIVGRSCTNVNFANAFNVNGNEVVCRLNSALNPGESVSVLFTGILTSDATLDPSNTVDVMGAASPSGCIPTEPIFACMDSSTVTTDVKQCVFDVTKDVTCDDPRGGGAVFEPDDLADALPGSMVGFRIRITNNGEVNIPQIRIVESLSCSSWFLPGTVVADINGAAATNCICTSPAGNCDQFNDINGLKSLGACSPNGIEVGETLTITFKVMVPDNFAQTGTTIDCTNNVTIEGITDTCASSQSNPCGSHEASARINVDVPNIRCDKCVCADEDVNGSCDTACVTQLDLTDIAFPLRLEYQFSATNTGETDLTNVKFTDTAFRNDATPYIVACGLGGDGMALVGNLGEGDTSSAITCVLQFDNEADFRAFATLDDQDEDCYRNTSTVTGAPDVGTTICESDIVVDDACFAEVCLEVQGCPVPLCFPFTKAVFEVWNEFESKFSGLERCIASWDQELVSEYTFQGINNYFWRNVLRTDKGKARIDGVSSFVCGPDTQDVPLLGLSTKVLYFEGNGANKIERAGMSLVGTGCQEGRIWWDINGNPDDGNTGEPPEELRDPRNGGGPTAVPTDRGPLVPRDSKPSGPLPDRLEGDGVAGTPIVCDERADISIKGSLIVFPKVEIKWDSAGDLIQDTFLDMTNDYPNPVRVQMYFVDGDCCVWLDNAVWLTANQPIYWSALTGQGDYPNFAVSPFTVLGPGNPDSDPTNPGGRVLRGYILAWAIDILTGNEINWNHLKGDAVIINYREGSAWEYNTWNFQAVANNHGQPLLAPFGQLDLNGTEYVYAPDELVLDFYASGAMFESGSGRQFSIDTDLTLWAAFKDLRQDPGTILIPPGKP